MGAAAPARRGGRASGWLWTPLLARRGLVVLGTGKSGGGGEGVADQVAGLSGEVSDPPPLYVLCAPRLGIHLRTRDR